MVAGAATLEAGSLGVGMYLQDVSDFGGCGAGDMGGTSGVFNLYSGVDKA